MVLAVYWLGQLVQSSILPSKPSPRVRVPLSLSLSPSSVYLWNSKIFFFALTIFCFSIHIFIRITVRSHIVRRTYQTSIISCAERITHMNCSLASSSPHSLFHRRHRRRRRRWFLCARCWAGCIARTAIYFEKQKERDGETKAHVVLYFYFFSTAKNYSFFFFNPHTKASIFQPNKQQMWHTRSDKWAKTTKVSPAR